MRAIATALLLAAWFLLPGHAWAESGEERVHAKFALILKKTITGALAKHHAEVAERFEAALARMPEAERTAYRQQLQPMLAPPTEEKIDQIVTQAFAGFQPELTVSAEEAHRLLTQGPNDGENRTALDADKRILSQSAQPKPEALVLMLQSSADRQGWNLELLRRLADGAVRQLGELAAPR
jgi:hypothetical protein